MPLILFLFGIYSSNYVYSHNSATAYIAFVLTVPVLFVARPMKKIGIILFFNLLFAITAAGQKSAEIFPVDIINAMVFGGISIIAAAYIMGIYFDYFVTKRQLAVMAEVDALTGLRNRNSFEKRVPDYSKKFQKTLTCIYMDVNGLHEVNDVKGHETGDQMLKFTGEEFGKCFGSADTYRIGGDEFIAFAPDMDAEELEKKIRELEEKTLAFGCFVSIGYKTQGAEKINMHTLIKSAEEQMYSNKKAFYQQIQYQRGKENSGLFDM